MIQYRKYPLWFFTAILVAVLTAVPAFAEVLEVSIVDFAFEPQEITIQVGDSVRWTNNGGVTHTTTSTDDPAVWDSGNMSPGETYIFQFTSEGSYPYFCEIHPSMTGTVVVESATAIDDISGYGNAESFNLKQNYPNPFNQNTRLRYIIPGKEPVQTNLSVYTADGRLVTELLNRMQRPGEHVISWNGRDGRGRSLSSGIYFYRLEAAGTVLIRQMLLLK